MTKRTLSPRAWSAILGLHALVAALTWRDIRARGDEQIRGSRSAWRAASALNTAGSALYWVAGRR